MQAHGNINASILAQKRYAPRNLLAKIQTTARYLAAMQKGNKALGREDEKAFRQNIIDSASNLIAHLQALGRLRGTLHILLNTHGHSLTTALIPVQLYPHQLTLGYMATHLAIGQKNTTLSTNIHKAAITSNANYTHIAQLALAHLGQLHAGSQALAGVQI